MMEVILKYKYTIIIFYTPITNMQIILDLQGFDKLFFHLYNGMKEISH